MIALFLISGEGSVSNGEDENIMSSCLLQNSCTFRDCRTGRKDVIDQEDPLSSDLVDVLSSKGPLHIFLSLLSWQFALRNTILCPDEDPFFGFYAEVLAYLAGDEERLIESSLPHSFPVQRNSDDEIDFAAKAFEFWLYLNDPHH